MKIQCNFFFTCVADKLQIRDRDYQLATDNCDITTHHDVIV